MTSLITPELRRARTSMVSASMLASVDVDQKFRKIADDINGAVQSVVAVKSNGLPLLTRRP